MSTWTQTHIMHLVCSNSNKWNILQPILTRNTFSIWNFWKKTVKTAEFTIFSDTPGENVTCSQYFIGLVFLFELSKNNSKNFGDLHRKTGLRLFESCLLRTVKTNSVFGAEITKLTSVKCFISTSIFWVPHNLKKHAERAFVVAEQSWFFAATLNSAQATEFFFRLKKCNCANFRSKHSSTHFKIHEDGSSD